MYQLPDGVRTWAWKPLGVRSKAMVAAGSVTPWPPYVVISGYLAASSGAMIGVCQTSKAIGVPSGAGRVILSAPAPSAGAEARSAAIAGRLSNRSRDLSGPGLVTSAAVRAWSTTERATSTNGSSPDDGGA